MPDGTHTGQEKDREFRGLGGCVLTFGRREEINSTPRPSVGGGVQAWKMMTLQIPGARDGEFHVWGAGEGYGNQYSEMPIEVLNLKEHSHRATCKYEPGPIRDLTR